MSATLTMTPRAAFETAMGDKLPLKSSFWTRLLGRAEDRQQSQVRAPASLRSSLATYIEPKAVDFQGTVRRDLNSDYSLSKDARLAFMVDVANEDGKKVKVFADRMRPLLHGADCSYRLGEDRIPQNKALFDIGGKLMSAQMFADSVATSRDLLKHFPGTKAPKREDIGLADHVKLAGSVAFALQAVAPSRFEVVKVIAAERPVPSSFVGLYDKVTKRAVPVESLEPRVQQRDGAAVSLGWDARRFNFDEDKGLTLQPEAVAMQPATKNALRLAEDRGQSI